MKFETLSTHYLAHVQNLPTISGKMYQMIVISSSWSKTLSKLQQSLESYGF